MRHSIFATFCSLLILCACSGEQNTGSASQNTSNTHAANNTDIIHVYTETIDEPFIMQRTGGRVGGFEYDLLQAIAEKQHLSLQFHPVSWEELFPALEKGEADIIASNITITPERSQKIDFSQPYMESTLAVLVGNEASQVQSFADLNGLTLTVQADTTHEANAKRLWPNATLRHEASSFTQVNAVITGQANAAIGDVHVMSYYRQREQQHHLRVLTDDSLPKEAIGFGIQKGNAQLLKQINDGLTAIRSDGTYDRIYAQWFGKTTSADSAPTQNN